MNSNDKKENNALLCRRENSCWFSLILIGMRWYDNELMIRDLEWRMVVGWEWMKMNRRMKLMNGNILFREEWNKSVDLSDLCDLVFLMKRIKE